MTVQQRAGVSKKLKSLRIRHDSLKIMRRGARPGKWMLRHVTVLILAGRARHSVRAASKYRIHRRTGDAPTLFQPK